jgi:ubiquitin carboxyl-terminal hydrolase 47
MFQLSNLSGIPVEYVEFAKGQGSFPCEISVLGIHTELDWSSATATLDSWPPGLSEDGQVILYR